MASSTVASVVFPQGVGYGVVIGIGFFFAFLMMFMSYIQVRSPTPGFVYGKRRAAWMTPADPSGVE